MARIFIFVFLICFSGLRVQADSIYWYNGDPNLASGGNGWYSSFNIDGTSMVYDNFSVVGGPVTVTGIFGNFFGTVIGTPVSADWEIRKGVSEGNGGTLVASGINDPFTSTNTNLLPLSPFTTTYRISVNDLNVPLAADIYWVGLRVISSDRFAPFSVFETVGTNATGVPILNDSNSFQNWSTGIPVSFRDLRTWTGTVTPIDVSLGVVVADSVPEPAAMWLAGAGLGVLAIRRRR